MPPAAVLRIGDHKVDLFLLMSDGTRSRTARRAGRPITSPRTITRIQFDPYFA